MEDLKKTLLQLLVVQGCTDPGMLVSLISYSSQGDMTVHFQRVPARQITSGSSAETSIRALHVTGLTCISQALSKAVEMIQPGEATLISLHSDGYANDRSPYTEGRALDAIVADFSSKYPSACICTIAYSAYSDFGLLDRLASATGGSCIVASSIFEVFEALSASMKTLEGTSKAIEIPAQGADFVVAIDIEAKKVYGAEGDLRVFGLHSGATILRLTKAPGASEAALSPEWTLACARAFLSMRRLADAKGAAMASRVEAMKSHLNALLPSDLATWSQAMEEAIFGGEDLHQVPSLVSSDASVLDICKVLAQDPSHVQIHIPSLMAGYKRRSIMKVAGKWDGGTLVAPKTRTKNADDSEWVAITGVDVSSTKCSMNLATKRPIDLVDQSGKVITEAGGISLVRKLSNFRNYTLVADGKVLVPRLRIKISSKALFDRLVQMRAIPAGKFTPTESVEIDFEGRPLVSDEGFSIPADLFQRMALLRVISSTLAAIMKGESAELTKEQIAALAEVGLSKNLFVNLPSTVPYADRDQAVANGWIDSYVAYSISLGSKEIFSLGEFYSANEFLGRWWEVSTTANGKEKKPTWNILRDSSATVSPKVSKAKVNAVDEFQRPIVEVLLGIASGDAVDALQKRILDLDVGIDPDDVDDLFRWRELGERMDASLDIIARKVQAGLESLQRDYLAPLAFQVGSTGLPPAEDLQAHDAEGLKKECPSLAGTKIPEGTFFLMGEHILGIYPETCWFSTEKGIAEARALMAGSVAEAD